jgi:FkbM family methyltransferase
MKPAIVVVAYNRDESLKRLLGSLSRARFSSGPVELIISIDRSDNKAVYETASSFTWKHGKKEIISREEHLGLKRHILACGDLTSAYGSIVLLEDDLFVSPFFYEFITESLQFYGAVVEIAGISLYSERHNETAQMPFLPLEDDSDVFFLQWPSSWGQCWTETQWQRFRNWYGNTDLQTIMSSGRIPRNVVNWPEDSWKKYFVAYMVACNKFFVYPRLSLSSNFGDNGVHHKKNGTLFQVPLHFLERNWRFKHMEDSVAVYDVFHEILPEKLKTLTDNLDGYDFAVDFYGQKNPSSLSAEYLLTSRSSEKPVKSYGKKLKPLELNVVYEIEGEGISLAEMGTCEENVREYPLEDLQYYYSIPAYFVSFEEQIRVKEESINNYYFNYFNDKVETQRAVIEALHSSLSWRLTAPLRWLRTLMGRLKRSGSELINPTEKKDRKSEKKGHFGPGEKLEILKMHFVEKVPLSRLCQEHGLESATFRMWQKVFFERGFCAFEDQPGTGGMVDALRHLSEKRFKPKVILDIGAAKGYWSLETGRIFSKAEFFMIDPLVESEDSLRSICRNDSRFHYVLTAVGCETGREVMNITPDCDGSSLLEYYGGGDASKQRSIQVTTIDQLLLEGRIKPPDLVKIDVQGFEMKVLQGGQRLFDSTGVFIIETNLFRFMPECPLAHEIIRFMAERDFFLFDLGGSLRRPYENDLAQLDLVFVPAKSPLVGSNRWN